MSSAEIRWVGIGIEWESSGYGNPYVGSRPTASDLLEKVNELLEDNEEFECSFNDVRMSELTRVANFIDTLRAKGKLNV